MAERTGIEWTDHTFNIAWGCVKVSPGCQHCYADTLSTRYGHDVWGPAKTTARRTFGEHHWNEPIRWNRAAEKAGERRRAFGCSMCDLFEDHPTIDAERAKLWPLIRATPWLDWQLLTKRPELILSKLPDDWGAGYPNVWLGTSVEDQQRADERIPHLLRVPVAVRFLSCEPLLGAVNLTRIAQPDVGFAGNALARASLGGPSRFMGARLDWVIVGGESGPSARPMHPDWARALRDQCTAAGVAFHFKQWGEWGPAPWRVERDDDETPEAYQARSEAAAATHALSPWNHLHAPTHRPWSLERTQLPPGHAALRRWGKKGAGRVLDGRTWDALPLSVEAARA